MLPFLAVTLARGKNGGVDFFNTIVTAMCKTPTMGFIKIHRNIRDWGWYDDANTLAVWIHLLIDANYEEKVWHGEAVGIGSLITSTAKLSSQTGLSVKQIRTCIERLSEEGKIVTQGASKWTKITICNYESYMLDGEDAGQTNGEQMASKWQADGEQRATPKEDKKTRNKEKRVVYPDAVERIYALYPGNTTRPEGGEVALKSATKDKDKIKRMLDSGAFTEESLSYAIKRYTEDTKPEYLKLFQTFLNQVPDYGEADSQPSSTPQVAPAPSSREADMYKATHPTEEEIKLRYNKAFLPIHPMLEGETREQFRERVRPAWKKFYDEWISRRVDQVNNKY